MTVESFAEKTWNDQATESSKASDQSNQPPTPTPPAAQPKDEPWVPTQEWVSSWKSKLPLQTIMRLLQVLGKNPSY